MILRTRPPNRGAWPRTPMGDLIDLGNWRSFAKEDSLSGARCSDLEMEKSD